VAHTSHPRTIADLGPGDHLCCLYETEEEHRAVLTPFLRQGLERGEKVVYFVDAHTAETILGYLRDDGLDLEPHLTSGQLAILTRDDAYLREGIFDPEAMITLLRSETGQALAEGYPALRVTSEMTWTLRGLPGSDRLIEYEARLSESFPDSKCLIICQYDQRRFDPEVLLDVLRTHPIAVVGTEVYDDFYYMPPAQMLGSDLPAAELRRWVQNLAERKQAEEERQNTLEKLREALGGIIQTVALTVEMKDPHTAGHQRRVGNLARAIANEMGLPQEQIDGIRMAGLIHDLGKVGIPAEILSKPGRLSDFEWGIIKAHSQIGYDILKTVDFSWPVAQIVFQHHERMDGSGYPQGLSGEEIMLEARMLAVADVVEAMASFRPYRPARGLDEALEEISQNKGILYDSQAVDACLKLFTENGFAFE